jgi:hypothetical protein
MILAIATLLAAPAFGTHNILDYGAVPDGRLITYHDTVANSEALRSAILAANEDTTDRIVEVPAGYNFTIFNVTVDSIYNIEFQFDGQILVSKDYKNFPTYSNGRVTDIFVINDSTNLKFYGTGIVDGQGWKWWVREFL